MNKKQISTIAVYAILLIVFNVIFFAVPFHKTAISWVSFAFTWIAFCLGYGITDYAFRGTDTLQSKVYGFPVFRVGYLYLGAQIIATFVLCAAGAFMDAKAWIAVVLSIVLLGAAMIGVIATDSTRDIVEKIGQENEKRTRVVRSFRVDAEDLVGLCKDPVAREKMKSLADAFQYSDPVSGDNLAGIEAQISNEVNVLRRLVLGNDMDALIEKIDEVQVLLAERNRKCKEGK